MTSSAAASAQKGALPGVAEENQKLRRDLQNSFHLVVLASQRAKQLASGARPRVDPGDHTPIRVAVLEVHAGMVSWSILDKVPPLVAPAPTLARGEGVR